MSSLQSCKAATLQHCNTASVHTFNSARIPDSDKPSHARSRRARQGKSGLKGWFVDLAAPDPRIAGEKRTIRQRIRQCWGFTSKRNAASAASSEGFSPHRCPQGTQRVETELRMSDGRSERKSVGKRLGTARRP